MPELKLYYFGARGRAELIRLLLNYANVPYDDIRVSQQEWPELKNKMPFGVMPVLEIDGFMLSETFAIARYVAREHGLAGKTTWEQARADMLMDGVNDIRPKLSLLYRALMTNDQEELEKQKKTFVDESLKSFLDRYDKFYHENPGAYFVGDALTWADIGIADMNQFIHDAISPESFNEHPALYQHFNMVLKCSELEDYIKKRPDAIF